MSWQTRVFVVQPADGVSALPDVFKAVTVVFVPEDFDGILSYSCSGCHGSGTITLVPARYECLAPAETGDEFHRVFASRGKLDDKRSCLVQCAAGYYRTHYGRGWSCRPHWSPVCGVGEFLVAGSADANAFCQPCSGCAGQQLLHQCTATTDDVCLSCGESSPPHIWTNKHGEPCEDGCLAGFAWNTRTRVCEQCLHRCPAGYAFSAMRGGRDNCTHCAACEELGRHLPVGAVWDMADDREDCVATCTAGYAFRTTPEGVLECIPVRRRLSEPSPLPTRCAEAGPACLKEGCMLHEEACIACFDLPQHLQKGLFPVEAEELKPEAWLRAPRDKKLYTWQFIARCEWQCLRGLKAILSEDGTYWKCLSREKTVSTLLLEHWDLHYVYDGAEWEREPAGNKKSFISTSTFVIIVVSVAGFPLALVICFVLLKVGRECGRDGPGR